MLKEQRKEKSHCRLLSKLMLYNTFVSNNIANNDNNTNEKTTAKKSNFDREITLLSLWLFHITGDTKRKGTHGYWQKMSSECAKDHLSLALRMMTVNDDQQIKWAKVLVEEENWEKRTDKMMMKMDYHGKSTKTTTTWTLVKIVYFLSFSSIFPVVLVNPTVMKFNFEMTSKRKKKRLKD